jgi:hypothetical protein
VAARHRRLAQRPCRPSHAPARGRGATQAICWLPSSQPNVKDRTCRALFHRGPGRVCWGVCSSRRCYTGDVHGPCPQVALSWQDLARPWLHRVCVPVRLRCTDHGFDLLDRLRWRLRSDQRIDRRIASLMTTMTGSRARIPARDAGKNEMPIHPGRCNECGTEVLS